MKLRALTGCLLSVWLLTGCDHPLIQKWLGKNKDAHALFQRVEGGDQSAVAALENAAVKRSDHAMLKLGYIYHTGSGGMPRSEKTAAEWYVQCKLPQCRFNLALLQISGKGGVTTDPTAAINALLEAANKDRSGGNLQAMVKLGQVYSEGKIVPANPSLAATWFEKAGATHSDSYALYRIGRIYAEGIGRPTDPGKAIRYLKKSADSWNGDAMYYLAKVYAEGTVVPGSLMESAMWMLLAREKGEPWKSAVEGVIVNIPEKELAVARRNVEIWKKAHQKYAEPVNYDAPLVE